LLPLATPPRPPPPRFPPPPPPPRGSAPLPPPPERAPAPPPVVRGPPPPPNRPCPTAGQGRGRGAPDRAEVVEPAEGQKWAETCAGRVVDTRIVSGCCGSSHADTKVIAEFRSH